MISVILLVFASSIILGLSSSTALAVDFGPHDIIFMGAVYDAGTNTTKFTYQVSATTSYGFDSWFLALDPDCFGPGDVVDASEPWEYVENYLGSEMKGIKFIQPYAPDEARIVWFKVKGNVMVYKIRVVLSAGCTNWFEEIDGPHCVGVPEPECSVDPPSAAICDGSSQQFCVIVSGGIPPFTYSWSNGAVTQCITVSAAGTYSITVSDDEGNVCTCEATLTVDPNPNCSVDPPSAEIEEGFSQQFCVVPSGGTPPFTYLWSTGETTECITVGAVGTYSVTVTDANDCEGICQATLTMKPPSDGEGRSPGYWKNELAIYLGLKKGKQKEPDVASYAAQHGYTAQEAYNIMLAGEGGTPVEKLHRQLLAAKLSAEAGYLTDVDEYLEEGQYMVAHPEEFTEEEILDAKDFFESLHD
jgi:hypothetical protein